MCSYENLLLYSLQLSISIPRRTFVILGFTMYLKFQVLCRKMLSRWWCYWGPWIIPLVHPEKFLFILYLLFLFLSQSFKTLHLLQPIHSPCGLSLLTSLLLTFIPSKKLVLYTSQEFYGAWGE